VRPPPGPGKGRGSRDGLEQAGPQALHGRGGAVAQPRAAMPGDGRHVRREAVGQVGVAQAGQELGAVDHAHEVAVLVGGRQHDRRHAVHGRHHCPVELHAGQPVAPANGPAQLVEVVRAHQLLAGDAQVAVDRLVGLAHPAHAEDEVVDPVVEPGRLLAEALEPEQVVALVLALAGDDTEHPLLGALDGRDVEGAHHVGPRVDGDVGLQVLDDPFLAGGVAGADEPHVRVLHEGPHGVNHVLRVAPPAGDADARQEHRPLEVLRLPVQLGLLPWDDEVAASDDDRVDGGDGVSDLPAVVRLLQQVVQDRDLELLREELPVHRQEQLVAEVAPAEEAHEAQAAPAGRGRSRACHQESLAPGAGG
jgi:hypothetical protein